MKIKIIHVIEIDPKKWADVYGIDSNPEEVKKDVQAHFQGVLIIGFDPLKFPIFFLACRLFVGKLSTKHGVTRDAGRN